MFGRSEPDAARAPARGDSAYMSPLRAAQVVDATPGTSLALYLLALVVSAALAWASLTRVDDITRADARVIPDGREQVIASLEGGILRELNVREGMQVEAGQDLALIDPTRFEAQQTTLLRHDHPLIALARGDRRDHPAAVGALRRCRAHLDGEDAQPRGPGAASRGWTRASRHRRHAVVTVRCQRVRTRRRFLVSRARRRSARDDGGRRVRICLRSRGVRPSACPRSEHRHVDRDRCRRTNRCACRTQCRTGARRCTEGACRTQCRTGARRCTEIACRTQCRTGARRCTEGTHGAHRCCRAGPLHSHAAAVARHRLAHRHRASGRRCRSRSLDACESCVCPRQP